MAHRKGTIAGRLLRFGDDSSYSTHTNLLLVGIPNKRMEKTFLNWKLFFQREESWKYSLSAVMGNSSEISE